LLSDADSVTSGVATLQHALVFTYTRNCVRPYAGGLESRAEP